MKTIAILILTVFIPTGIHAGNPTRGSKAVIISEFIYKAEDVSFPSCHASTIVETSEGVLAAWFGGTAEKNPDVCIFASRLVKGIWSKPVMIADGVQDSTRFPCWNPVLFKRDNGDIVLYYKVGPDPRHWWGLYTISKNNGNTWSTAVKIPDKLLGPIKNKPVRLPDGKILYPTSIETSENWSIYMEISGQDLTNWQKIMIDNNSLNSIQPTVLFQKDGTLQLLCRSRNKFINESRSNDNGRTWTPVIPTRLPNNNSGIDAVTLADGRQVLVFNPITRGRFKLALAVSDDGVGWNASELLENDVNPDSEYSYPAIIQTREGLIHITYTWNRKSVRHVVIDPKLLITKSLIKGIWPE